jgi:hypothetical protein
VRAKVGRSVGYPWAAGLSTRTATVSVG